MLEFDAARKAFGSLTALDSCTFAARPGTAALAMPNRVAMGATLWWEPLLAVAVTLAAIVALVVFGGRVYTGAILHTGPTLKLRDAWRGTVGGSTEGPTEPCPGSLQRITRATSI